MDLQLIHDPAARLALVLLGFGTLAGASVFLALGAINSPAIERWRLARHLAEASRTTLRLCRSATGARVAALSLGIHLLTVTAMWAAGMAVNGSIGFIHVLLLVLPVLLIATLPVSIGGWGVREGAMTLAFAYAGFPQSDGLIVSIIFGVANLALGAVGGIVWIAGGYQGRYKSEQFDKSAPAILHRQLGPIAIRRYAESDGYRGARHVR